mgnify:CR=1 FL=1
MRKGIFDMKKGWLAVTLCLVLVFSVVGGLATESARADDGDKTCTFMHPDRETLEKWIEAYNTAPVAYIGKERVGIHSPRGSVSLLNHLEYTPAERDQGYCGNCWAWAGTGCLGIELDIQEEIKKRLSVQYINSCEYGVIRKQCCEGGWLGDLADFYTATQKAIPWSNTNANWQSGDGSCGPACDFICTDPNYPISSINDATITTQTVNQATAIANIKYVLNQNKAIWFAFYLPNSTAWDDFGNFWWYSDESVIYDIDKFCGTPYDFDGGGGHAVLCVGYNDEDPDNSYWIMLNSWGTGFLSNRPNGLFRINMDMNYSCVNPPYYSFYWQTLNITWEEVTPPSAPTLISPADGSAVTDTSVTFTWEAASGATDYRLVVYRSLTAPYGYFYNAMVGNVTSKQIDGFPNDDTLFYWKVIAYNSSGTAHSAVWSFTNGQATPLSAPTLISPADGSAVTDTSVTFTWEAASGATDYRLVVYRSLTAPYGYFYNAMVGNVTSKQIDGFPNDDTLFYWKVIAYNSSGTAHSAVWSFTNGQRERNGQSLPA